MGVFVTPYFFVDKIYTHISQQGRAEFYREYDKKEAIYLLYLIDSFPKKFYLFLYLIFFISTHYQRLSIPISILPISSLSLLVIILILQ